MNTEILIDIDNILNSLNTLQIDLNNLRNKLINNSNEINPNEINSNQSNSESDIDNESANVDSFGLFQNLNFKLDLDISKLNIDDEKKSD